MPVALGDVLEAEVFGRETGMGVNWINVYHYEVSDLVDGDEPNVALDFQTYMQNLYATCNDQFSTEWIVDTVRVTNQTQKLFVGQPTVGIGGNAVGPDSDPGQIAVEVLARSRQLGHVGRKYLGPVAEGAFVDGELTAAAQGSFTAFLDLWEPGFSGGTTLNIYLAGTAQFAQGGVLLGFRAFEADLGSLVSVARTMRTRIPGRGF